MLRNLIGKSHTTEIFKIADSVKRGAVVTKDYATKTAKKASGTGVELFFVDYDFQPTGIYSDMEISNYTDMADVLQANSSGILIKPQQGETWATDQCDTNFTAGDYAIAGTTTKVGTLVKAVTGNVSVLRYVGTYDDAGHTLQAFEVVESHTV